MAVLATFAQERRKEERRKQMEMLDRASKQIIAAADSSQSAGELLHEFLAISAKAIDCSSAVIVIHEGGFLKSKFQYELSEAAGRTEVFHVWTMGVLRVVDHTVHRPAQLLHAPGPWRQM